MDRYARQTNYRNLGEEGQKKLLSSRVAVVGAGALGCVSSNELVRAGIGFVRIIDGDQIDLTNLHRQILFTEEDAKAQANKAQAAAKHLRAANSSVTVEDIGEHLVPENADRLLSDVDLVIDATDSMEARYLINEYCVEHKKPWIYGGAVGSEGMTAAFLPGGSCFCCFTSVTKKENDVPDRSCRTFGVLNSLTAIIASLQVTEAVKLLTGADTVRKGVLFVEIWDNEVKLLPLEKDPDCPVCGKREYQYLKFRDE